MENCCESEQSVSLTILSDFLLTLPKRVAEEQLFLIFNESFTIVMNNF